LRSRLSLGRAVLAVALLCASAAGRAQAPLHSTVGRFTAQFYPNESRLAHSLLELASSTDTFPGLARPKQPVTLQIAPDYRTFRAWSGAGAPEWGAAIAIPSEHRIVMQGRSAGSDAGDPREVVRHELAHLALHEALGDAPPRWFDEGYASYAARELTRDDVLAANLTLALRGMPTLDELDEYFAGSAQTVQAAYALSYRAVAELSQLDTAHGLSLFVENWKHTGTMDRAMRATYGMTFAEFEQRWRDRTRRRYGMLALVGDFTLAGALVALLLGPLYVARRRRDRRRMAALISAEAASEAAARSSEANPIEELLRPPANANEGSPADATFGGVTEAPEGDQKPDRNRTTDG
jgi:peptidase MA superfamily protein